MFIPEYSPLNPPLADPQGSAAIAWRQPYLGDFEIFVLPKEITLLTSYE